MNSCNLSSNFARLLLEIFQEEKIDYKVYSHGWSFGIEKAGKRAFLFGYQFGINSDASAALCTDKAAASEVLSAHGIPNVEHIYFMNPCRLKFANPSGNWNLMIDMLNRYGTVVCKENRGTGGEEVYLAESQLELEAVIHKLMEKTDAVAICPYFKISEEYRVIILDGCVRLVYSKIRPGLLGDGRSTIRQLYGQHLMKGQNAFQTTLPSGDMERVLEKGESYSLNWKHNLGQGARAEEVTDKGLLADLGELALKAYRAVGVRFASVDLIKREEAAATALKQSKYEVMEINSGVMMEYLSGDCVFYRNIAKEIYRDAVRLALKVSEREV